MDIYFSNDNTLHCLNRAVKIVMPKFFASFTSKHKLLSYDAGLMFTIANTSTNANIHPASWNGIYISLYLKKKEITNGVKKREKKKGWVADLD